MATEQETEQEILLSSLTPILADLTNKASGQFSEQQRTAISSVLASVLLNNGAAVGGCNEKSTPMVKVMLERLLKDYKPTEAELKADDLFLSKLPKDLAQKMRGCDIYER